MVKKMFVPLVLVLTVFLNNFVNSADPNELIPDLQNSLNFIKDDSQCALELENFRNNLDNMTLWAFAMWESSAREVHGSLRGSTYQLGDFEECIKSDAPFQTQYCLVELQIRIPRHLRPDPAREKYNTNYDPNGLVFHKMHYTGDKSRVARDLMVMGICTPASCSGEQLQKELDKYAKNISKSAITNPSTLNVTYGINVLTGTCQVDRSSDPLDAAEVIFCIIMAILIILVIIATIYDFHRRSKFIEGEKETSKCQPESLCSRLILCFSARATFKELPRADDSNPALQCLYGVRTICIFMIIIDHRLGTYITSPLSNREYSESHFRSWACLFIFHGDLFVDSFFVLGGLLVTYGLLVHFEGKRRLPAWLIVLNRYMRLTPVYALVVLFYAGILYRTGTGPMWSTVVGGMRDDCKYNWWASLLYLSNYVNDDHICMVHSWFLPCDFHYFILAIPTVILLSNKQSAGIAVMFIALIIAILIPFSITLMYQRPALLNFYIDFLTAPKIHPDFRMTYTKSHTRAGAYIIGMFTGYTYYKMRDSNTKLSLARSNVITVLAILLLLGGMASGGVFYNPYHPYSPIEAALYAGLHRVAWAIGTALILLNSSYGRAFGSFTRSFFSWKSWVPLSKLVYGAYLVHMCWQLRAAAMATAPRRAGIFDMLLLGLGDIFWSFILALLLYILVETPFRKVFRALLSNNKPKEGIKKEATSETENGMVTLSISNDTSRNTQDSRM